MKINVAATTHIGKRKKSNQDRILVRIGEQNDKEFGLFVIADGMGGLSHGEKAADLAVAEADRWWKSDLQTLLKNGQATSKNISTTLTELAKEIHYLIQEEGRIFGEAMGTTLSALLLIHGTSYIVHLGDSRIYKINSRIEKLTQDHTWVQAEVDAGRLTETEALTHKRRNALLQCAGMPGEPEIKVIVDKIQCNDAYLICSDGFYHYIEEQAFLQIQSLSEKELKEWLNRAEKEILNQRAHDNLTAITLSTSNLQQEPSSFMDKMANYFK